MNKEQEQYSEIIMTKTAELAQYIVLGIASGIDGEVFQEAYAAVKDEFDRNVELGIIPPKFRDVIESLVISVSEQFPEGDPNKEPEECGDPAVVDELVKESEEETEEK